jgi:ferredoxin
LFVLLLLKWQRERRNTVLSFCPRRPVWGHPFFSTTAPQSGQQQKKRPKKNKPYVPKWVKKETLADSAGNIGSLGYTGVGLKGAIPVVFQQGNNTRTSMAWAGQPIRDVASQAGQYIQYGCGKGECGTCECMMNGRWVRPCVETVPANALEESTDGKLVLQIKAIKSKTTSSGTFFSIRSFFMGFWNNLLGMFGFLRFRKKASENWDERKAYEDLVAQKTLERKLARQSAAVAAAAMDNNHRTGGKAAPGMA